MRKEEPTASKQAPNPAWLTGKLRAPHGGEATPTQTSPADPGLPPPQHGLPDRSDRPCTMALRGCTQHNPLERRQCPQQRANRAIPQQRVTPLSVGGNESPLPARESTRTSPTAPSKSLLVLVSPRIKPHQAPPKSAPQPLCPRPFVRAAPNCVIFRGWAGKPFSPPPRCVSNNALRLAVFQPRAKSFANV